MTKILLLIILVFYSGCLHAQTVYSKKDSVKIYFGQGKSNLDPAFGGNMSSLNRIADSLPAIYTAPTYRLRKVLILGGASPEGSIAVNKRLSEKRAMVLFEHLSGYDVLPDSLKTIDFVGRDWNGLIELVENDPGVPYKEETLLLLREIAHEAQQGISLKGDHYHRLKSLHSGIPYNYMYKKLFPELRVSWLYLWYEKVWNPILPKSVPIQENLCINFLPDTVSVHIIHTNPAPTCKKCKTFYMDIRTNMLYDALLLPNIGMEFYLGENWSVTADWMYGWWKTDRKRWYWRAYGGDIAIRKWLGKASRKKPLTGHHLGLYGQIFTYDFEAGGRGYMGGKPGGTLWDKMNYATGIEYGYSLPIAKRLNIDFAVGIGYWGGTYYEYTPCDEHYVWQSTKQRCWIGPTKADVSLIWLIGRENFNGNKGGGL